MGWDYQSGQPSNIEQYFKNQWERSGRHEVLDIELVKKKELYAAIKDKTTGEIFAIIYLVDLSKGDFGYKAMDETVHPYYYNCPERIFKLLNPTTSEYANQWRAKQSKKYKKTNKTHPDLIRANKILKENAPEEYKFIFS